MNPFRSYQKYMRPRTWLGVAVFTAIVVTLQFYGDVFSIGSFSVSLVLLPIVVGAAVYGPVAGAWLGLAFGIVVLLSGDANALIEVNAFAAISTVLIKGALAGYVAGLIFRAFSDRSFVLAAVLAAVFCPVVNTGIFLLGMSFFLPTLTKWGLALGYKSAGGYIIREIIGNNFLLELLLNLALSPLALMLIFVITKGIGGVNLTDPQAEGRQPAWRISLSEKLYFLVTWIILIISLLLLRGQEEIMIWHLVLILIELIAVSLLCVGLMNHMVTKPLGMLTKAAKEFGGDDTGFRKEDVISLPIDSHDEIGDLYHEIRSMQSRIVDDTARITQITAEKERIETELALASRIQASMLPSVFPPYPGRNEFDIYASMNPAKEVGGDFYDFFLIDEDHLCLVIADVSGKGIPAALFMMASKIVISQQAGTGKPPAQIMTYANNAICANNPTQQFVTVWVGILELSTGKLTAVNAGHEYPVLKTPDGAFEILKDKHGFVVGGMEGVSYKEYELLLEPGAKLFLYTDGVPEAMTSGNEFFGTERLLAALNEDADAAPEQLLQNVRGAIDAFVKDAEQFDDLTMLCVSYQGSGRRS